MPVKPVSSPPSTSTPGPSTPPRTTGYRRSPSVTEAIQQFESKTRSPPVSSSPSNTARRPSVPTPTRSSIPSRIGPTVKSPPGSPRRESRTTSSAATPGAGSSRMTGVRSPDLNKTSGIGLGVAGGSKIVEHRRATESRIRSTRPSPTTPSSSIPRPSPGTQTASRTLSSPRIPTKPFPAKSPSLPRSTSDTFYSSTSSRASTASRASTPSSMTGPPRMTATTPKKTSVAISVSRASPTPSPSPDKRPPPLRRKSSKADLTSPRPKSTTGIRRPSHRVSDSISPQSSAPSPPKSKPTETTQSKLYFGEFGERENQPTPITLESGSSPMLRKGSKTSQDTVAHTLSVTSQGSPKQERISITIPKRTSSNPNSPKTPRSAGPHPISPRTTSRRLSSPTKDLPSPSSARRASKNLGALGPAVETEAISLERPAHRRGSSQSSVSRLSEAASTIREPIKRPTSAANSRPKGFPSSHSSPRMTAPASPRASPSELAARRLSNSPRKSPNLTIQTPPPPPVLNSRLSSISSSAQPSPPVPAKSPLRGLSRENSDQNYVGRKQTSRSGSGESNIAQAGTPTSLRTRLEKMAEMEEDSSKRSTGVIDQNTPPQDQILSSSSQMISTPNEIRFTNYTVPSMYSQDSAPATAKSWAWSEATARSSVDGTARRRQSRLDSVEWGKQKDLPPSSQRSSFDVGREGGHRRSSSLPRLSMVTDKALPYTPDETPTTAATYGSHENSVPSSPITNDHREPAKSPSMPILREGKIAHHIHALTPDSPSSAVNSPTLLASANVRHSGATETTLRPLLPTSPSIVMSKRSHLLREIASSERAYAKDLALIRDAYMYRFLRPGSQHSTNGESSVSPSDVSRRSSVYTYQTAETKRSSGHDSANWIFPTNGSSTPLPKSPSDGYNLGYFPGSAAGSSNSSFSMTPQPSLKNHKRSSSSIPSMAPPVGKPLSPTDLKTVFLNLDQLAGAADDLATAFEQAMGEEDTGIAAMLRDGEAGSDRLGQAFVSMIPRLRPLYNFYCARQSQASLRLMELQSDFAHNTHLKECWSAIKDHTHAWNLDSMLIKPVQRITKYPLLFDDLLSSTTPVHPDYFAIRTAAQMSKAIAMEIDEAKRRKDVVSNAINSNTKKTVTTIVSPKTDRQPASKLLGLKRFRKDKSITPSTSNVSLPLSKSTSSNELALPAVLPESSLATLKDLVTKVEELDQCVRRVGKEIILWTAAAKEVLVAEDGVMRTWLKVVQLEPTDPTDRRMLEFRKVIDTIIAEVWKELNDEVRQQIMPIFAKLLESTSNPRKVIHKRDTKYLEYTRYLALKASKKTIERTVIQSAGEFVALHTQLVDELPAFLEGCLRILDIALVGFAKAQAKYHERVKERLAAYEEAWVVLPLSPNIERSPTNTKTSRGIVKAWHISWAPYAEAMDHFQCTRPARTAATRIASFNAKPGSRPVSRANSPMLSPGQSQVLRHSASVTSPTSLSGNSRPSSPAPNKSGRFRSSSLRSQTVPSPSSPQVITVTSPTQSTSSMFSLLRRSNSKNNVTKLRSNSTSQNLDGQRPSMHSRHSSGGGLKPSSASIISEASSRLSWGLPSINADPSQPIFDGLGLSPTRPTSTTLTRNNSQQQRAISDPIAQHNIFSVDLNSSQVSLSSSITNVNVNSNDSPQNTISSSRTGSGVGLGLGDVSTLREGEKDRHPFAVIPSVDRQRPRTDEVDAAEGWRNEQVIYQCACVAEFDPVELGDRRYRGLKFLPMISGDLIDVFHEVGRIDELPSFPYPEVGVDNDGVLVARSENGDIGLVICSFLEPLRD